LSLIQKAKKEATSKLTGVIGSSLLLPTILACLALDILVHPEDYNILFPLGLSVVLTLAFIWDFFQRLSGVRNIGHELRTSWFDLLLLLCVVLFCAERCVIAWLAINGVTSDQVGHVTYFLYSILFYFTLFIKIFTGTKRARSFIVALGRSPSAMTAFTFTVTILLGGMLLCLPQSVTDVGKVSFIDALFISTSSTCVTGLASVDISTYFTRFGHVVILLLIQAGGLGIITMSVLIPMLAGRRLEVSAESRLMNVTEAGTLGEISKNVRLIFIFTLAIELAGAILLFARWSLGGVIPENSGTRLFSAVFHSVSAFCNAGFSLFSNNLESFASDKTTSLSIAFLIILGGIGFPVLINLWDAVRMAFRKKLRLFKLTFHSKVVLSVTGVLLLTGTFLFLLLEWNNTLEDLTAGNKVVAAFFLSVTPRTAGYNTVPIGSMAMITLFIMIALMFIGASPQSTGGGVKTTTFGTIVFTVRSLLTRRERVEAFRRTIPPPIVYRASALVFISMVICGLSLCLLLLTETGNFLEMLFEVVSAFGTVGLSMGLTPNLTVWGKLVIIITMLVGRIGPLTLAVALAERPIAGRFRYADDHVIIG